MDDEAAGKIQRTELSQEAAAPYPVCHRIVNQDSPEKDKDGKSSEFHALCKGTSDECWGNDGKHALESHKGEFGDRAVFENIHTDTGQAEFIEAADETVDISAEGHGITNQYPFDRNHGNDEETLHDGGQYIFTANHAAIKESKSGSHNEDQGRTDEDPSRIARINHGNQILSFNRWIIAGIKKASHRFYGNP